MMPKSLQVHIAKNHKEADEWDLRQALGMSPQQRMEAARKLQKQFFGKNSPDVRECGTFNKKVRK